MNILLSIFTFLFLLKKLSKFQILFVFKLLISFLTVSTFFFQNDLLFYLQIQVLFIFWISISDIKKHYIFLWIISFTTIIFFKFTNIELKDEFIYTAFLALFSIPFFTKKNTFILGFILVSIPIAFHISNNFNFNFTYNYYIFLVVFSVLLSIPYVFISTNNFAFIKYSIYFFVILIMINNSINNNNYECLLGFILIFISGTLYLFEYINNKNYFILSLIPAPGLPIFLILSNLNINNIFSNILIVFSFIYLIKTLSYIINNFDLKTKSNIKQILIIFCFAILHSLFFLIFRSKLCLFFF